MEVEVEVMHAKEALTYDDLCMMMAISSNIAGERRPNAFTQQLFWTIKLLREIYLLP